MCGSRTRALLPHHPRRLLPFLSCRNLHPGRCMCAPRPGRTCGSRCLPSMRCHNEIHFGGRSCMLGGDQRMLSCDLRYNWHSSCCPSSRRLVDKTQLLPMLCNRPLHQCTDQAAPARSLDWVEGVLRRQRLRLRCQRTRRRAGGDSSKRRQIAVSRRAVVLVFSAWEAGGHSSDFFFGPVCERTRVRFV
jgi:hypothetical protein